MNCPPRPIITLKLTIIDQAIHTLTAILLLILWITAIYYYITLPQVIPTHIDSQGNSNGNGERWTLFILPLIATAISLAIFYTNRSPHKMNYIKPITPQNALKQYTLATRFLRTMNLLIVLLFNIIFMQIIRLAIGLPDLLGKALFPLLISIFVLPLIFYIIKTIKTP